MSEQPKAPAPPDRGAPAGGISAEQQERPRRSRVRRWTWLVLTLLVALFCWHVLSDRFTPYTEFGRVDGIVVPIVPRVSGHLVAVEVGLHDVVEKGDVVARIDPRPFEIAVASAEANLDLSTQQVGAGSSAVKAAAAQLGASKARLDRAQRNFDRVEKIRQINPGALSQYDIDQAETSLAQAVEGMSSAEAILEQAEVALGALGPDNPALRAAVAALEKARYDLEFTTIRAPIHGAVDNFKLDVGYYAATGQPIATFVSARDVWVQADLRENNITNTKVGDRVEIALDVAPGEVFAGQVTSIGYGIAGQQSARGDLLEVSQQSGWLRDPQRIPVIVKFTDARVHGFLRVGGQADVVVYTGEHPLLNPLAELHIRLLSWLSFVR